MASDRSMTSIHSGQFDFISAEQLLAHFVAIQARGVVAFSDNALAEQDIATASQSQ